MRLGPIQRRRNGNANFRNRARAIRRHHNVKGGPLLATTHMPRLGAYLTGLAPGGVAGEVCALTAAGQAPLSARQISAVASTS